jgi:hypothetical protein
MNIFYTANGSIEFNNKDINIIEQFSDYKSYTDRYQAIKDNYTAQSKATAKKIEEKEAQSKKEADQRKARADEQAARDRYIVYRRSINRAAE